MAHSPWWFISTPLHFPNLANLLERCQPDLQEGSQGARSIGKDSFCTHAWAWEMPNFLYLSLCLGFLWPEEIFPLIVTALFCHDFYLEKQESKDDQVGYHHISSKFHFYYFTSGQQCLLYPACSCDSSASTPTTLKSFDGQPHLHLYPSSSSSVSPGSYYSDETEHLVVWDVGKVSIGCGIWPLRDPQRSKCLLKTKLALCPWAVHSFPYKARGGQHELSIRMQQRARRGRHWRPRNRQMMKRETEGRLQMRHL